MSDATEGERDLAYWSGDRSEPILEVTVGDTLRKAAGEWGSRIALIEGALEPASRRRWTFEQLLADSEQVARALLTRFEPGEHLAVWSANCPEWVLLEFGASLAGLTLVTINPAYITSELSYVLSQSNSVGVIVQPEYRGRDLLSLAQEAQPHLYGLREVIPLSQWREFMDAGSPSTRLPSVSSFDIAQIQYTSGTTGFPKGAELRHRGLANVGRLYAQVIGAGPEDIWVNPMPMFHTAGCGLLTLGALQTGGAHILPSGFDPALMLDLFQQERGTVMLGVPTMLIRMLDEQQRRPRDLSSWRLSTLGGAPVPPELVRRAQSEIGMKIAIGFGQTEASPYITHTLPDDPYSGWLSSVGRPLPQTEVKIIDFQTGFTVPFGTIGEICARGVGLMKGYYNNVDATEQALDREGWLHTGDLGSVDRNGYCTVQGRLKDMIIRGGENIYPREIEDVLFTHPAIAMAAVVGLPDQDWGEKVAAFVQFRPGLQLSEDELTAFCRQHLASYKVPRVWRFVSQFPQTASEKIQKFVLRNQYLAAEHPNTST